MRISSIINNHIPNYKNNSTGKVTFGEFDGDYCASSKYKIKITKEEYEIKKDIINEKYKDMKHYWLDIGDDIGMNNVVLWEKLNNIEKQRRRELKILKDEYEIGM